MRLISFAAALACAMQTATPAQAQPACGGNFRSFVEDLKQEAISRGHASSTVNRFFAPVQRDTAVIQADRRQGVFRKSFTEFARHLISRNRLNTGRTKADQYGPVFDRIEREYGVSRGVLLAFWAFETDFGGFQGNFSPANTTGAWAGEIGMVQMLPEDILTNGIDGDGDGKVSLKTSAVDALMSGANMLRDLGWRAGEPWLQEVTVPADLDWSRTGLRTTMAASDWEQRGVRPRHGSITGHLPANIILPEGHRGPAFIAYPNFRVFFEWNQSFTYVLTAAYFANRLEGAPVFDAGNPAPGLSGPQMKQLQRKLQARGYDVGKIDGILGAGTRAAVQDMQQRLGLPADAWPTQGLLGRL